MKTTNESLRKLIIEVETAVDHFAGTGSLDLYLEMAKAISELTKCLMKKCIKDQDFESFNLLTSVNQDAKFIYTYLTILDAGSHFPHYEEAREALLEMGLEFREGEV